MKFRTILENILTDRMLLEYEILPFQETRNQGSRLEYKFNIDDLEYVVTLLGTEDKQLYELGFGVIGQDNDAYRTGKDVQHLNTVLYTVDAIVKQAVTQYRIKKIVFAGARGDGDSDIPFIDPIRLKIYYRFLTKKYPNAKFEKSRFGDMEIYMNSIYPEVFAENKDKKEIMLDFLTQVNNASEDDDYWRWDSSFYLGEFGGINGDTDSITNADYGQVYLGLDYDPGYKEYSLSLTFFETDEEVSETFKKFDDVMNYLKRRFDLI